MLCVNAINKMYKCKFCSLEKDADLHQAQVLRINDYLKRVNSKILFLSMSAAFG